MLESTIAESKDLARWIHVKLYNQDIHGGSKGQVAASTWSIALEHCCSIIDLIELRRGASAKALLRPIFDAYLRGLWIAYRATDEQVKTFMRGEVPNIGPLIAQIEEIEPFNDGHLTDIKSKIYRMLCDYTHTGAHQVRTNMTATTVEPVYRDDDLVAVLQSANSWAIIAGGAIASVTGNKQLEDEFLERAKVERDRHRTQ